MEHRFYENSGKMRRGCEIRLDHKELLGYVQNMYFYPVTIKTDLLTGDGGIRSGLHFSYLSELIYKSNCEETEVTWEREE